MTSDAADKLPLCSGCYNAVDPVRLPRDDAEQRFALLELE